MNARFTALIAAMAIAAFQCMGSTSRDAAALQRELEELRKQYETEHLQLEAYRLAFGNMQQGVGSLDAAAREKYLLDTIASTDRAAAELAIASSNFVDQVREAMKLNPLPPARAAQMSLRIEDLEKVILRTTGMLSTLKNRDIDSCRVLKVDRKAGVAVVTVGRAGGAFPGITYMSGDLKLRLVATADLVSAAEVISGTIDDVTPGMELSISEKRSDKFIIPR